MTGNIHSFCMWKEMKKITKSLRSPSFKFWTFWYTVGIRKADMSGFWKVGVRPVPKWSSFQTSFKNQTPKRPVFECFWFSDSHCTRTRFYVQKCLFNRSFVEERLFRILADIRFRLFLFHDIQHLNCSYQESYPIKMHSWSHQFPDWFMINGTERSQKVASLVGGC